MLAPEFAPTGLVQINTPPYSPPPPPPTPPLHGESDESSESGGAKLSQFRPQFSHEI